MNSDTHAWPALPYADWQDTCTTLHLWTQVVGKVRVALAPWLNHSWHVALYVTARGLTTSAMPAGDRALQIDFDFIDQALVLQTSDGGRQSMALQPQSVAEFHAGVLGALDALGVAVTIHGAPNEVADPVPFAGDTAARAYDGAAARRFWQALVQIDRVFNRFRTGFIGKCSPVHFFWGSFDLAVTRFSGRTAPAHPGGFPAMPDAITREAYSHEVSSAGFWPGGGPLDHAAFYAYAYPTPDGFADAPLAPDGAWFDAELGEFLLPYDTVRQAADPDAALLAFLQSTYEAAAVAGDWDRPALEVPLGRPGVPRALAGEAPAG